MNEKQHPLAVESLLDNRKLAQAINMLSDLAKRRNDYALNSSVSTLRDDYLHLLHYFAQGTADPQRNDIFNQLLRHAYLLNDKVFDTHSILQFDFQDTFHRLLRRLSSTDSDNRSTQEDLKTLFSLTMDYPLPPQLLQQVFDGPVSWKEEKAITLSALMLKQLRTPNLQDFTLLLRQTIKNDEPFLRAHAIVALTAILITFERRLPLIDDFAASFREVLNSDTQLHDDFKQAFSAFFLSSETALVSQQIQHDIIPQLQKVTKNLTPEQIQSLTELADEDDPNAFLHANDKRKDIPRELADEMLQINRLSEKGTDVHFSSFAHLKKFDFFNTPISWLRPFNIDALDISDTTIQTDTLNATIQAIPTLCDSDRFSLALAFINMPSTGRDAMLASLPAATSFDSDSSDDFAPIALSFVQDLYRFFSLYSSRHDFRSPFAAVRSLGESSIFDLLGFSASDIFELASEAYDRRLYSLVINLLLPLSSFSDDANLPADKSRPNIAKPIAYRKLGLAYLALKQYDDACKYLQKFYLQNPSDTSAALDLARSHYLNRDFTQAATLYANISNDLTASDILRYARCLYQLHHFQESLDLLFRVELDDATPSTPSLHQHIALVSARLGKDTQALRYARTSMTPLSSIVAALILLKSGTSTEAFEFFSKAFRQSQSLQQFELWLDQAAEHVPDASSLLVQQRRFILDYLLLNPLPEA